ncbi:MAG: right-handed parallel beta-helix repeat-containing protein, partial [Myxococcota bacterium]|nr:right-handed parallel beta-helix repeat-containing protein [Myxococcota bacterium]
SALRAAVPGSVIALARGRYEEPVVLHDGVSLRGACSAETTLHLPSTGAATQTVAAVGSDTALRSVTVTGAGWGIVVQGASASLALEGVIVRSVAELAIAVTEGASLSGSDVAILLGGSSAAGIEIADSSVSLESLSIIEPFDVGVLAYGAAATCELGGAVVRGARVAGGDATGSALVAEDGARIVLRRGVIVGSAASGVYLHRGASAELEDVLVRDSAHIGVELWGASIVARRARVAGSRILGVHLRDSTAVLDDVVIDDSGPSEAAGRGIGLLAWDATVRGSRIALRRNHLAGIVAHRASELTIDDVVIADTRSEAVEQRYGRGLTLSRGARAVITRARIERVRDYGIAIGEEATSLSCADCTVLETMPQGCFQTTCGSSGAGVGIGIASGATLRASSLAIRESSAIGMQVLEGGSVDVEGGVISRQPIGLNLQTTAVDVGRDLRGVMFLENARNLAREDRPGPDFPEALFDR